MVVARIAPTSSRGRSLWAWAASIYWGSLAAIIFYALFARLASDQFYRLYPHHWGTPGASGSPAWWVFSPAPKIGAFSSFDPWMEFPRAFLIASAVSSFFWVLAWRRLRPGRSGNLLRLAGYCLLSFSAWRIAVQICLSSSFYSTAEAEGIGQEVSGETTVFPLATLLEYVATYAVPVLGYGSFIAALVARLGVSWLVKRRAGRI